MRGTRPIAALFGLVLLPAAASMAMAGDSGTRVAIGLAAANGGDLATAAAGTPLKISIGFTDALDGSPVTGLFPRAWVRRIAPGSRSCTDAAWMVRASGALAADDFPLDGRYLVSLGSESPGRPRLTVTDPAFRLGVANTISITQLDGAIDEFRLQGGVPRALLVRRGAGEILAVDLPTGGVHPFASGLAMPGDVESAGDGKVLVGEEGRAAVSMLDAAGERIASFPLGGRGAIEIARSGDDVLAMAADGAALLFGPRPGEPRRLPPGSLSAPRSAAEGVAISAAPGGGIVLRWLDDAERAVTVALPFAPDGMALHRDGERRFALAWQGAPARLAVVDLSTLRLVFDGPLDGAVVEAASAGSAVALAHGDGRSVSVVDLGPVASGAQPLLRRIDLPPHAQPGTVAGPGRLVSLFPEPMALYLPPGADRAYRIAAGGGLANAPMSALRVQGDRSDRIALLDRGLAEVSPGDFEAMANLPRGGNYQVVVTTGPGGTTACAGFFVAGPGARDRPPARLHVRSVTALGGGRARLSLDISDPPERLPPGPLSLHIQDLAFGAPRSVAARPAADGAYTAEIRVPASGRYIVAAEQAGLDIAPTIVDLGGNPR